MAVIPHVTKTATPWPHILAPSAARTRSRSGDRQADGLSQLFGEAERKKAGVPKEPAKEKLRHLAKSFEGNGATRLRREGAEAVSEPQA